MTEVDGTNYEGDIVKFQSYCKGTTFYKYEGNPNQMELLNYTLEQSKETEKEIKFNDLLKN
mgnify:CR=1 FL=1